ncbi:dihydrodipicolinate reductase [Angustibacter sp. McL0619]|uniref:NAD(P)H-dependent amine dehydrogenase family protein n=1 Tax=Angustibacter sp. McL0619 TaxID=3415676 RepID=UPI003CFB75FC
MQWATGSIGRTCLRAVLDSPDHELVGLVVYSERKAGQDAGTIARRDPTGVIATRDIEQVIAMEADVVLHTPRIQLAYDAHDADLCRLLRSGKNVITTAGNHYPGAHGPQRLAVFDQACADGGSTLFGVGVSPGVIGERLAMALTGISLDLDAIDIAEVVDASAMVSPDFVFTVMGMGTDPKTTDLLAGPLPPLYRSLYSETLAYMADQLGLVGYDIEDDHHLELAPSDVQVGAGLIREGTVVATEWRWHLSVGGRRRISLAIIWTMAPQLPRYAGRPHWVVQVSGQPDMTMTIELHEPTSAAVRTSAVQSVTAGVVMRAIPVVLAAPPGVLAPVGFAPYRFG